MIKLKSLIEERRSVKVNVEQAIPLLMGEHNVAWELLKKGHPMIRGINESVGHLIYVKPSEIERRSRWASSNCYTAIFPVLPSWINYPKRSRSIVFTSSKYKAYEYGSNYAVILKNDAKIGACPKEDFWYSFSQI